MKQTIPMHGRTHRPGGSDPIPAQAAADPIWVQALASAMTMNDDGAFYTVTFDFLHSNSTTAFTEDTVAAGRFKWISMSEPGYYILGATLVLSTEYNTIFTRIDPMFSLSGSAARMQSNMGAADFRGVHFNRASEQDAAENAHPGYYVQLAFNWNPSSPVSNFDFENPLKIGLTLALAGGPATMALGEASIFMYRLAGEGYQTLF